MSPWLTVPKLNPQPQPQPQPQNSLWQQYTAPAEPLSASAAAAAAVPTSMAAPAPGYHVPVAAHASGYSWAPPGNDAPYQSPPSVAESAYALSPLPKYQQKKKPAVETTPVT
uniref:Uncharacterized protein n=1 Tax=Phaeomonas parva TaxID=124430 RepID=A0A7S1UIL8_9STRA